MRRSRVYLGISILSLVIGVGIARSTEHRRQSCRERAPQQQQLNFQQLYEEAIAGNDKAAIATAERLLESNPRHQEALLFYGYALRGDGRHADAEEAYSRVLKPRKRHVDTWILIDAYTGRAAARIGLGDIPGADQDLSEAMRLANLREQKHRDQTSAYQLACVHAQLAVVYEHLKGRHTAALERSRAVDWLLKARKRGYSNDRHMRNDRDLAPLHTYPDYLAIFG
ncbi:MAG: hypothetical protein KF696_12480 [Planctomycetes bacterium]|nr:hypothetical protein [Planctomycetota bacterium]MCW8136615.1 hypothetical protein [Planctomycetota bacterium]